MVSMLNPLEVYVSKQWLQRVCRSSLTKMKARLETTFPTDDQKQAAQLGIQQRVDLFAWLTQHPDDRIYISMYPTDLDGTDDLEVDPDWFNEPE